MKREREAVEEEVVTVVEDGEDLSVLLARNRAWAHGKTLCDPDFFSRLVGQQRPRYFWIGCSDSRVPATEIVDLDPGEMFVHRNVANLAVASDPNFSAALKFAVDILEVRHIIVVGHYGCGGIHAAMASETDDVIGRWLAPVRRLYGLHRHNSDSHTANTLVERNVVAQVRALTTNAIVRAAWRRGASLFLHGWVYAIGDGKLERLCPPVREGRVLRGSTIAAADTP